MIEHVGAGFTDVVSYEVRVGFKTTGDPFVGIGSTTQFLIEGNAAPVLHLTPGKTYRFWQDDESNLNNQIKFYTDQTKTTEITAGVTTVGSGPGLGTDYYTQLDMHMDTGAMFYYESDNGSYMGNMVVASVSSNMTGISTMKFTDIDISGKIYDNNGSVGAAGSVLSSTGSGVEWITASSGGSSAGGGDFNTSYTNATFTTLTGIGTTVLTLPSTSGKQYIIHSIFASNVAAGNTEVNVIGSFDIDGGERSYFGWNLPIPTGLSLELLKQPQVLNPSDRITMRSTDYNRAGVDNSVQVYITYEEVDSTDYIGVGVGTVGLASTSAIGIFTSTTYPSVIESIRLSNVTDTAAHTLSVIVNNGSSDMYLVDDLVVPKYSSIELLDISKRNNTNDVIKIQLDEASSIDVQISGKKIV